jgi:hypothetical protein
MLLGDRSRAGVNTVGPSGDAETITFRFPDPCHRLTGVRLVWYLGAWSPLA